MTTRPHVLALAAALLGLGTLAACGSNSSSAAPAPTPAIVDINGGLSASGTLGSVFIVDGSGFGDLSAATPGYSLDFRDATSNAVVASATAGVNFAAGAWRNLFITATVPAGLTAGTTYKVTVTTPGGTTSAVSFLILAAQVYAPNNVWTKTSSLTAATQGLALVTATIGSAAASSTYVYAVGGNTATTTAMNARAASTSTVSFNSTNPATGALSLANWTLTNALPAPRGFAAAVVATPFNSKVGGNGTLYVLGGLDSSGAASSTIYEAPLAADGTVGAWTTVLTMLPQPLFAHGAVIFHGRIYVAGGNDATSTPVAKVYSAKLNSDGSLGAWATLTDLPAARAYAQLVTAAGNLYVVGGTASSVDPVVNTASAGALSTVVYAGINLQDGTLVAPGWQSTSALNKAREKFSAVVAGGGVLVTGGLYNGSSTGASEQEFATINSDGTLATFANVTGAYTISKATGGYNFYNHASTYYADAAGRPHVLVVGGEDVNSGAPHLESWFQ